MKNKSYIVLLVLMGCYIKPYPDRRAFPPTLDTMLIKQARYVSNTSTQLIYDLDLYHLGGKDYGHLIYNFFNSINYSYLVPPTGGKFELVSDNQVTDTPVASSSSVILIDQSGSFDLIDPYNNRTQGVAKLCSDYASPSQYLVGGFSQNGKLGDTPIEFIRSDFSRYTNSQLPLLLELSKKTGGKSNLYDAVDQAIDKVIPTTNAAKNVIILAHSVDEVSSATLNGVIAKANSNQVRVHLLYLDSLDHTKDLAKLAEGTGGLFAYCPTIKELMASFEDISLILDGSLYVQTIRLKYTPDSGTIASGQEFWFTFNMHDPEYNYDYNPIVAYIKVP